jgi:hypothetical protein
MTAGRQLKLTRASDIRMSSEPSGIDVAKSLILAGAPVFAARRDYKGHGTEGSGYWLPLAWPKAYPDTRWLDGTQRGSIRGYRPMDALGLVCGIKLDLIDIDPRNGGDVAALDGLLPHVYARATTPSGGVHLFVAPLHVSSKDGILPGIDVKSGTAAGNGRGFAWLSPTVKANKVTGELSTYTWTTLPPAELPAGPDGTGAALIDFISRSRKPSSPRRTSTVPDGDVALGERALVGLVRTVLAAEEGGRNAAINWAAYRAREHVAAGRLTEKDVREVLALAAKQVGIGADEATKTIDSGLGAKASAA